MADIGDRPSREEREAAAADALPHCPISICPVGMAVNRAANDSPRLLEPVELPRTLFD